MDTPGLPNMFMHMMCPTIDEKTLWLINQI